MPVKQNEQAAGNGGGDAVSAEYLNIPLSEIVIDAQIRSEIDIEDESFQSLKASIRDWNVMVPILLMRMEKGYRLITGERRLRACRELGLPTIPARILDMEGNREEILRIQLTENLQRADLDPIDEANAYVNYFTACHDSLDQEEINNVLVLYQRDPKRVVPEIVATVDTIANISGKSASSLRNRLTLLRLPGEVQASLRAGEIPPSQGYILAENPDRPDLLSICQAIVAEPVTNKELRKLLALSENAAKGGTARQAQPAQPFKGLYTNLRQTRTRIENGTTPFEKGDIKALLDELKALSVFLEERLQADADAAEPATSPGGVV